MEKEYRSNFGRLCAFGLCICCFFLAVNAQKSGNPVIKGTIRDIQGAVVPNATVIFENNFAVLRAVSSEAGEYSIALAPATYSVSVDARNLGFEILLRSPIRVMPKANRTINMIVTGKFTVLGPYDSMVTDDLGHTSGRLIGYTYDQIRGLGYTGISTATVSFATRCESKRTISFRTDPFNAADGARVTLTYDFVTVTANEIRFDKETQRFFACGNVHIEADQAKPVLKNCVDFSLKDGILTIF